MLSILQIRRSNNNSLRDEANRTSNKQLVARLSGLGEDIPNFKQEKAIFLVSVGGEYFEDENLIAQLKLIKEKFGSCLILVGDKLQRHNILAENSTDDTFNMRKAEAIAIQNGEKWIRDNYKYFSNILGKDFFDVQKWDSWLSNEDFDCFKNKIEELLKHKVEYIDSLKDSIEEYSERCKKRIGFDKFSLIQHVYTKSCQEYLVEEAAVMLILAKQNYKFALYPAKQTKFLQATYDLLVQAAYPNMMQWIPIRFKKILVEYKHSVSPNVEMLAKIATEQIQCFLKQLESTQEKEYFINFLIGKICPMEESDMNNYRKPNFG